MTYRLYIGDRTYFSWSLAAWLMFENFGLAKQRDVTVFAADASIGASLSDLAPARTVPTMVTPEGAVVSDSLAIAEELATRHPEAGHWPADPLARATARTLAAEMHSGFPTLRGRFPVNLHHAYSGVQAPDDVRLELDRLELIWSAAWQATGATGPWLTGPYSLADAIFAPMATRLATYGFVTGPVGTTYVAAHLADPALRRWRAMALARHTRLDAFELDHPHAAWPGPAPLRARAVDTGPSENTACPYSGDPVTHFMELADRTFGFCNAFCRDKTVADPSAWPAFIAIYHS